MHIIVIGSGVYGLGAAHWLSTLDPSQTVTVLEREKVGHPQNRWASTQIQQKCLCQAVDCMWPGFLDINNHWRAAPMETPGYSVACTARATTQVACRPHGLLFFSAHCMALT